MTDLASLSDLISEKEVYERYKLFADRELLEARQSGELEFYRLRKGIYYTESQLIAYLEKRKQRPCQNQPLQESESNNGSGNSRTSGLGGKPALRTITGTGTPEQEPDGELIARALERQT